MPSKLSVISRETPHEDVVILHVERPMFDYHAGQYAFISIDGENAKPYSIASCPNDVRLSFHFKKGSSLEGLSHKLTDPALEKIYLHDIKGHMTLEREENTPLILCGGGVGLAPLKSLLDQHTDILQDIPVKLFWGVSDETQLYIGDWLSEIKKTYPHLSIHLSIDRVLHEQPADIHIGYVSELMTNVLKKAPLENERYYIAGPPAMVFATIEAIRTLGVTDQQIYCDYLPRTQV